MEWLNAPAATVVAAVIAATIALAAALISLVGVLISAGIAKRNGMITARTAQQVKHADFRQNWINKLREQMALFQAKAFNDPLKAAKDPDVGQAMLMIMMLLDRQDPNYLEMTQLMYDVMTFGRKPADADNPFSEDPDPSYLPDNPLYDAHARFVEICQMILKGEWEVTKTGLYSLQSYFDEAQEIETLGRFGRLRLGRAPKPKAKADAQAVSTTIADAAPMPEPIPTPPADPK